MTPPSSFGGNILAYCTNCFPFLLLQPSFLLKHMMDDVDTRKAKRAKVEYYYPVHIWVWPLHHPSYSRLQKKINRLLGDNYNRKLHSHSRTNKSAARRYNIIRHWQAHFRRNCCFQVPNAALFLNNVFINFFSI